MASAVESTISKGILLKEVELIIRFLSRPYVCSQSIPRDWSCSVRQVMGAAPSGSRLVSDG